MGGTVHRIAILSDTHGLLRPEVVDVLRTCEAILHGGDLDSREILGRLERIAPVYAVRGNNDGEWAEGMAEELKVALFGLRIYMVHNKKRMKEKSGGADIIIYGHSHKYEEKTENGVLFLNPGSCGPRRFRLPVTMAVLEVQEETGEWKIEKVSLDGREENGKVLSCLQEGQLKRTVETILRDMKAGRKVERIAKRLGVERGFVEQVCRIYVTHPGVDAQGIVDKMEVSALFEHGRRL